MSARCVTRDGAIASTGQRIGSPNECGGKRTAAVPRNMFQFDWRMVLISCSLAVQICETTDAFFWRH